MNQIDTMKFRNETASYVKSFHIKRDVVNLNAHNSKKHELIKAEICYELKKANKSFITEAPILTGKRTGKADILVLDTAEVIEIMVSESEDELRKKVQKYPSRLTILGVINAMDYFEDNYKTIRPGELL